jgi:hydrogenase-4 component B
VGLAVSEWLVLAGIVLVTGSGVPRLFATPRGRWGERLFAALVTLGAACASAGAVGALALGASHELSAPWQVPGGRLALRVDAISAMFVLQIALIAALGAWYGLEYWAQRAHPRNGRKLRAFYGAVIAGMLLLVVARNGVLFLVGWEVMALGAFVLVTAEDDKREVRWVGYVYLVATRLGTLCLFAMFGLLAATSGTLEMDGWPVALASPLRDAIFVLGLLGFGLKAGVMPLHVWLPGAHANAPSHVSAIMSGVLIKMGIYGLVRLTAMSDVPPLWWGYLLVGLGAVSGVLGVAFAIGQHDVKRLLAYHSVENIGIIVIGLGVALIGRSVGRAEIVALGIGGALLHCWNHGLFKALLFLSAGAVVHATGTREIDRLGGLWARMPRTGFAFLVGAVAICGLPPLNGLVSEILIYLGLFRAAALGGGPWLTAALGATSLALIGALALACFVKVFGAVFLGQPRTGDVERAHDPGRAMLVPMGVLAAGCVLIGLGAPLVAVVLDAAVVDFGGVTAPALVRVAPLGWVGIAHVALLVALVAGGWWLAARARRRAAPGEIGTWDCGYAAPSPRMQYTSSSFAQLLVSLFGWALRPAVHRTRVSGTFPGPSSFHSHVPDVVLDRAIVPIVTRARIALTWLHPMQRGSVHLYLAYVLITVVALLFWR